MPRRLHVCSSADLRRGEVKTVRLADDTNGALRQAIVLRDEENAARAYLNRCKHLPILLDGGSREFLTADGRYVFCGTHGARYRLRDGVCVFGPCVGAQLDVIDVYEEGGNVFLVDR